MKSLIQGHPASFGKPPAPGLSDLWPVLFTTALYCLSQISYSPRPVCSASSKSFESFPSSLSHSPGPIPGSPSHLSVLALASSLIFCLILAPFLSQLPSTWQLEESS